MKEIRRILKEETVIPENIDKAMEDVLSGILNSPDEKTTGALNKKTDGERTKNSGNKKKIIRILLPVAAILGVSTGVLATNIGRLYKELEQQGVAEQEAAQMVVTEPESTAENVENCMMHSISRILPGFRCAVAVVRSNRMSYYMRKGWILPPCRQQSARSARQKC